MKECTQFLTDEDIRQGNKEGHVCTWSPNFPDDCLMIDWHEVPDKHCKFHRDVRLASKPIDQ